MDQDLLAQLLAAFPPPAMRRAPARDDGGDDALIIRGYRIAADRLDERLATLLASPAPAARAA
jgi:hypothetical protein